MAVKKYLMIGKETTFGTKASTKDVTIDPESVELDPAGDSVLFYEGISGLDRFIEAGRYESGGSVSFPVDNKTFGHFVKYALGATGYTKTGTAPSITHTFVPAQDPRMDSFTAFVGKDVLEHVFTGCSITNLTISGGEGFVSASVDIISGKDEKATLASTVTFTTGKLYGSHTVAVKIGGTDQSTKVESFTLSIDTGAKHQFNVGNRYPSKSNRGSMVVSGDLSLSFDDTNELERYWGSVSGASNIINEFQLDFIIGAASTDISVSLPATVYTSMGQPVSGRGRIEQSGSFRAKQKSDGTGPIQVVIVNDVTTY